MSIRQMIEKLKSLAADQVFYACVIVLVAGIAFGLGRWSVVVEHTEALVTPGVQLIAESDHVDDRLTIMLGEGLTDATVIGSRNGSRYYYQNCTGVNRIAPENRLYFVDASRAQAAGYTLAARCSRN